MKKLLILLALLGLAGCGSTVNYKQITSAYQLNTPLYRMGGSRDTESYKIACKRFSQATQIPYNNMTELLPALQTEKIDAAVFDRTGLDYAAALYKGRFIVLPEELAEGHVAIGTSLQNGVLIRAVNDFIREYRANGTYKEMYKNWVLTPHYKMKDIDGPENPVGVLRVGTETKNVPMNYIDRYGNLTGFNIEFAQRLAGKLNMKLEFVVMEYKDLYEAAATGKIDLAIASLDVTPEMEKEVLFSHPYIDCPVSVLVRKEPEKKD